jgi:hypothetical protein
MVIVGVSLKKEIAEMVHDLNGVRIVKLGGKGGPNISSGVLRAELLSGYMYPKLHKSLRKVDRFRKRKMHYE